MPHPLYALLPVRQRRQLTVEDLAQRASLTARTLHRLERGAMPTYTTTRRLARALRVQPATLLHVGTSAECMDCQAPPKNQKRWLITYVIESRVPINAATEADAIAQFHVLRGRRRDDVRVVSVERAQP